MKQIKRRKTPLVRIGHVAMGHSHPVVIQSMTDTPTSLIGPTLTQIKALIKAGSELVRITVNDEKAMKAVEDIIRRLRAEGYLTPIIGDFHFNGHVLLKKYPKSAQLLDKYRINPGNIGKGQAHHDNFTNIIKTAMEHNKPVRIGVNGGSIDQELLTRLMEKNARKKSPKSDKDVVYDAVVRSVLDSAERALDLGLKETQIVLSAKMSVVQDMVAVYKQLAKKCSFVLHLGLTEAGSHYRAAIASAAGLAILLQEGIGDTLRISLTPQPNVDRTLEVEACQLLLQSLGLRYFKPTVTSCPGCGRTDGRYFRRLAKDINAHINKNLDVWKKKYPGIERLKIAVMGCVVNGPGESQHADIGISLPGSSEEPVAPVYIDGRRACTLKGRKVKEEFIAILEEYIRKKFCSKT